MLIIELIIRELMLVVRSLHICLDFQTFGFLHFQMSAEEHHLPFRVRQESRHGRGQALLHVQVSGKQSSTLPVRHSRLQRSALSSS